jgi:hypothetical protein
MKGGQVGGSCLQWWHFAESLAIGDSTNFDIHISTMFVVCYNNMCPFSH